ncbi:MAG: ABC transporter substrate-binding protein [Candidatus Nitronauta litoralis]|uniref:ABC transporter substrate-binding protein n=1 Tax=Candidatus Nitronauta litoralis TaxID=2705533 RepID=A0A7T0BZI5_9BACT|nr:MAG: ABC transporter substrate-binding protein [Candidatus Nitronauta litoralis]
MATLLMALVMSAMPVSDAWAGKKTVIKFATLAPEGSSWMKQMRRLEKEVKKATNGQVRFKFYPGGVSGDEKDVIRKMRIGQVHAAGFTGVGLGEILPEVRVLDLPFLLNDNKEMNHVYDRMTDHFTAAFEKKGYVLLGWVPVGWIHFFSKQDVGTLEALRKTKAWMWDGDPLVQAAYKELGISPHPLSVTDVMMALQTGMVETVYASPVGTLALQWFTKVNYMSQIRMGHASGAVLISKRQFKKIPDKYKGAVKDISKRYLADLVKTINSENEKAIEVMQKNGMKLTAAPGQEELDRLHAIGEKIQKRLTGKLFDQKLLDKVQGHLNEIR